MLTNQFIDFCFISGTAARIAAIANKEDIGMANEMIERNRQIARRFDDFLLHGGDPNTLFSPDFVYNDPQGNPHDLSATMVEIQPFVAAIPDRGIQVEEMIITDDRVVLRWRRTGTFQNDAWGLRATGNRLSDVGVTILAINADGMISQSWEFWDAFNFFTQLGVIREYVALNVPELAAAG